MNRYDFVSGAVHRETQRRDDGFDLTAAEIYVVEEPGRVDFGGGELASAELEAVTTEKREPEDDYGWWSLETGTYIIEHNERLATEEQVEVSTRPALLERGAYHPTLRTKELRKLPLTVLDGGVRIKENARVSTLRLP